MLKVSAKPRRRNSPRPAEKSAPGFLKFVRGRDCVFALLSECEGKIEPMHLDWAGGKGVATKVADRYTVPACSGHHRRQHTVGWRSFMAETELTKDDLIGAADFLWRRWPGRAAWERKLSDAS